MTEGPDARRAGESFRFVDYEGLVMPTGLRAANLRELVDAIRRVPVEVIHHHLHRTALSHRFGAWDYPNDFAQWAAHSLEDRALAEKLAALDPFAEVHLEAARAAIADVIDEHLDGTPLVPWARPGFEFYFASGLFMALPSERDAWTLPELQDGIADTPLSSLYYHFHESRLRAPRDDSDDFSRWIVGQFGPHRIAHRLRAIDFYFFSLQDLRDRVLQIFTEELREVAG